MYAVKEKELYVVLSQTGTILSRILKFLTRAEYNHASVSLDPTLNTMYSFGRIFAYYPFWGGFVKESKNFGTFKRFSRAKILVLAIPVSDDKYDLIEKHLNNMYNHRKKYGYNYLGLYLAALHINHKSKNRFYCSEFVKDVLIKFGLTESDFFSAAITQPAHFIGLPDANLVYKGELDALNNLHN